MPAALCVVPDCPNTGDHILPTDEQRRLLWIDCIRGDNPELKDWWPKSRKYLYVCRGHFRDEDYQVANGSEGKRRFLKRTAIPSVFPWSKPPAGNVAEMFGSQSSSASFVSPERNIAASPATPEVRATPEEDSKRQLIYSSIISQHADHLLTKLYVQFIKRRNCDLTIKLSDMYIYAHTCVLDAFTNTGKCGNLKFENLDGKSVLDLGPFQCDIILPLIEMMYTGELAVIPSLVDEVAQAAKFIGFQEAYKGCEVYMKLHKKGQDDNQQIETQQISPTMVRVKAASNANTPESIKIPALQVREPRRMKGQSKGQELMKGERWSDEPESEADNSPRSVHRSLDKIQGNNVGARHREQNAQINDNNQELENEFEMPVRIKEEPPDEYEIPTNLDKRNTENQEDFVGEDGYQSFGKIEDGDFSVEKGSEVYGSTEKIGSLLDQSKAYAGSWVKNSMNLNTEFAVQEKASKNVYTVLPFKPSKTELYTKKKRGRPRNERDQPFIPSTDDYINNEDNPLKFDFDTGTEILDEIPLEEQDILNEVTKDLTADLANQVSYKRKSEGNLNVKLKEKEDRADKNKEQKHGKTHITLSDKGLGNTPIPIKMERVDDYEQNSTGIQADSEIPDLDLESEEETLGRRLKRRRTSRQIKRPNYNDDYDYDSNSDEEPGTSTKILYGSRSGRKEATSSMKQYADYDDFPKTTVVSSSFQKRDSRSTKSVINPSLLKGERYVGTICRNAKRRAEPDKKSKKVLKSYLDSIGLDVEGFNESDSDIDSDREHLEIDGGVRVIQPNVTLPKGTRSRYLQPTVAQVKHRYVRKKDGELKRVESIVKTKPKIFQGHQKKPNAGPVYVMCHPTKPIVRL